MGICLVDSFLKTLCSMFWEKNLHTSNDILIIHILLNNLVFGIRTSGRKHYDPEASKGQKIKQDHLRMNVATDRKIIYGLQIVLGHGLLGSIGQKIVILLRPFPTSPLSRCKQFIRCLPGPIHHLFVFLSFCLFCLFVFLSKLIFNSSYLFILVH